MKKSFKSFVISGALFGAFIIWTLLVKFFDVSAVGPLGSEVGFSAFNQNIHQAIGINKVWYDVSALLGLVAILVVVVFAVVGVIQAIKRKSIKKVNSDIMLLGSIYCLTLGIYMFFEYVIINFRPVLVDGALEASYPSSHTLLALVIFGTGIIWLQRNNLKKWVKISIQTIASIFAVLIVVGRILSGVHWMTDIIGSIILSASIIMIYISLLTLASEVKATAPRIAP